jgi:hypothetical protein
MVYSGYFDGASLHQPRLMSGPFSGVRIVELAGIGPGPFAASCSWIKALTSSVSIVSRASARARDRMTSHRAIAETSQST